MAIRILMLVAVLMALYGCGQSAETKDSSEGVEPLGSEASAFGAVVLTGQHVELEINNVVELADRPGLLLASVYLECGYAEGGPCEDPYPSSYKDLLNENLKLVVVSVLSLLVGAAVLLTAFYLVAWLLPERPQATREPNSPNRLRTVLTANWLAWLLVLLADRPQATREPNRLILPERPQATREPNSLNRLGTFLRADWLRTAWIGLGIFFFVMVVVPGALLIYHYSGIGD